MVFPRTPVDGWWEKWQGIPYKKGGRDWLLALDCWGLCLAIWAHDFGFETADPLDGVKPSPNQCLFPDLVEFDRASKIILPNWQTTKTAIPGAAVLFLRGGLASHVGLVTGGGYFLHTAEGLGSRVIRLDDSNWRDRFGGYFVPA
jgi:cell wall-associated NlpC family hydrolase